MLEREEDPDRRGGSGLDRTRLDGRKTAVEKVGSWRSDAGRVLDACRGGGGAVDVATQSTAQSENLNWQLYNKVPQHSEQQLSFERGGPQCGRHGMEKAATRSVAAPIAPSLHAHIQQKASHGKCNSLGFPALTNGTPPPTSRAADGLPSPSALTWRRAGKTRSAGAAAGSAGSSAGQGHDHSV